jgi:hypothetical protein
MRSCRIDGHRLPIFTFKELGISTLSANQLCRRSATKLCSVTVSPMAEASGRRTNQCGRRNVARRSLETASFLLPLTVPWAEGCSGQIQPFARRMNGVAELSHAHLIRAEYGLLRLREWLLAPTFKLNEVCRGATVLQLPV